MTVPNTPDVATQASTAAAPGRLPRVNLLPPEILEAAKFRRMQLAMAGAGVAAVAVVAFLGVSSHQSVNHAREGLASAQVRQANMQSQLNGLQSVQDVYSQVSAKKAMLARAMAPEIRWSYYLTDLSLKVPDNVWLTNVTAAEGVGSSGSAATTSAASASVAANASLSPSGIGNITFAGVAFSHDDVATWLDTLARERGFDNVYFSNSTKALIGNKPVVNFSSTVNVTPTALSGRFVQAKG